MALVNLVLLRLWFLRHLVNSEVPEVYYTFLLYVFFCCVR
jgi:hypothetical protein